MDGGVNRRQAYTVVYNSDSHVAVLTQMWGSVWPKVLPYCIFNVGLMGLLIVIDHRYNGQYNIEISMQGHTFLALVMAFLLVSRVQWGVGRYNQARDCLGIMYRVTRELLQDVCVLSAHNINHQAAVWRNEVAYRALLLLRTTMAVVDFPEDKIPAWKIPQLRNFELEAVTKSIFANDETHRLAHEHRSEWEETMRVPTVVAYLLRKSIHSQADRLDDPLAISHENKISGAVDQFMSGYYGIHKFMTTPIPFPLIQMARTLMFVYTFTVPFVMLKDDSSNLAHCFTVFVLTYGFVGLELVAIELDNPFGDDDNDFDNNALAMTAYEDVYMTILDIDGREWTDKLRLQMYDGISEPVCAEQRQLFDEMNAKEV